MYLCCAIIFVLSSLTVKPDYFIITGVNLIPILTNFKEIFSVKVFSRRCYGYRSRDIVAWFWFVSECLVNHCSGLLVWLIFSRFSDALFFGFSVKSDLSLEHRSRICLVCLLVFFLFGTCSRRLIFLFLRVESSQLYNKTFHFNVF